jgi:hypothetical protein
MADPICVACSRPILPTDDRSTVEQVDACTMVVERVTYHATCRDQKQISIRETQALRRHN